MAEIEKTNGKKPSSLVQWKRKKKSSGSVGPSPFEVPIVSINAEEDVPASSSSSKNRKKKVSSWHRLKRRLTRKGVVPVNKDHPRYQFLSCICEGIRTVASVPNQGPKDALGPEDFSQVIRKKVNYQGKEFEFESYAGSVFATIRRAVGIEEDVYIRGVAPNNLPYLEFISNSKSGQDFFLSNDMQCMFKSNRARDVHFFLCLLEDYLKHFISYPHSLLVKYIGCYTIKFRGRPRRYFLVMQSIFFPSARIEDRFDVKGCTAGRYQKPNPPASNIVTVLKDQNFLEEELDFGDQGEWFMAQIMADTEFLTKHNCMDYSLLLGRQRRHATERKADHVATVVDRIGLSIHHTSNVRLRAPSLDSEFIDSDREDHPNSGRMNNISSTGSLNCDKNNDRDKTLAGPGYQTSDLPYLERDDKRYDRDTILNASSPSLRLASGSSKPRDSKTSYDLNFLGSQSVNNRHAQLDIEEQDGAVVSPRPPHPHWIQSPAVSATVIMPQVKPGLMFPRCLSDGVEKFRDENRRLLPRCQNRLHIIDGQDYRYFLGVVDFLTRFDWRQKFAQYWKMVKYRCGDHSTKRPDIYRKRFVDFLHSKVR